MKNKPWRNLNYFYVSPTTNAVRDYENCAVFEVSEMNFK